MSVPRGVTPREWAISRFWPRVEKTDGCWVWKGIRSHNKTGYGVFMMNRRIIMAHRFSYELNVGTIPDGLLVLHHCDNPPCVRPDHLFVGTDADNAADKVQKGRQNRQAGERHGMAILTEAQVKEIFLLAHTTKQKDIARMFGINPTTVSDILKRRRWKHVKMS